jgi:peptidyl-prolyl cis-trans isomerase SurA
MVDDYQTIKNMLKEKKRQETFEEWVRKKQEETYISISDNWKDCTFNFRGWIK